MFEATENVCRSIPNWPPHSSSFPTRMSLTRPRFQRGCNGWAFVTPVNIPPLSVGSAYALHGTRSLIGEAFVKFTHHPRHLSAARQICAIRYIRDSDKRHSAVVGVPHQRHSTLPHVEPHPSLELTRSTRYGITTGRPQPPEHQKIINSPSEATVYPPLLTYSTCPVSGLSGCRKEIIYGSMPRSVLPDTCKGQPHSSSFFAPSLVFSPTTLDPDSR